jgi:amino acid adenylation domain-containing protein
MSHEAIHELFHQAAMRFPHNIAIARAGQEITYRELEETANNLANFLLSSGLGKGSVVAILSDDSLAVVRAMLAILKAGGAFVPLDPDLPEKRLEAIVEEVSPEWFLVESKFFARICAIAKNVAIRARVVCLDEAVHSQEKADSILALDGLQEYWNPSKPDVHWQPDDMCYLYFTSGSTGRPKGIAGRLKGIDHFIRWEIHTLGVNSGTRVSLLLPLTFDGSLRDVFVPLCAGGTICIPQGRDTILDAHRLAHWLDEQRIEIVHCVPSVFRSLINENPTPDRFPSLRAILLAGEPLLPSDVGRWMDIFGERVQLINLYGTSETTMAKFIYFVKPSDKERPSIPVGKPMPGARALILDEKAMPCPSGVVGEIYIRTPYRSLGYYRQPELTSEVFITNPFNTDPEDIVYKTGDLGRLLEDGNYEYLGRTDQQVKIRGVRVELGEIENLLRKHGAVRDVVVIDRQDRNQTKYLCAYVVLDEENEATELRDYLSAYLPVHMLPSVFIPMRKLPRTLNGKVDRKALPTPAETQAEGGKNHVAPRTPIEEMLAGIWMQVLGVSRVGIFDNFFQLGGHSLLATQIISRVRVTFDVDLPLPILFEKPTVAGQAESIDSYLKAGTRLSEMPILRIPRDSNLPLSFAQQRLWILNQLERESPHYNMPATVRLSGTLNVQALEQTISEIVRRHEALRTVFPAVDSRPVQIILPATAMKLRMLDISHLAEAEREVEARRLTAVEFRQPFALASGPLVRAMLVKVREQEHIAIFTMHHIVCDGWSMGIIMREVAQLYRNFVKGEPSSIPDLTFQYADFAAWQRQQMQGEILDAHLSYWQRRLADLSELRLPTDYPRPQTPSYSGGHNPVSLPRNLTESLKELSRSQGCTLYMALAAAFKVVLHWYSRQDDIVIGTDVANRNRSEIEGMVGFFVNQLVLRTDLSGNPGFRDLLQREREVVLGAYAHQDLPFDKLVEILNPDRSKGRSPLFQVKLVLQNIPQEALELPALTLSSLGVGHKTAKFDLMLTLLESPDGMTGVFEYSTALFDKETVHHMEAQLQRILRQVIAQPDARLSDLREILNEADRQHRAKKESEVKQASLKRFDNFKRKKDNLSRMGGEESL